MFVDDDAVAHLVDSFYIAKQHYLCCQCFIKGPVAVHSCIVGHFSMLVAIVPIYSCIYICMCIRLSSYLVALLVGLAVFIFVVVFLLHFRHFSEYSYTYIHIYVSYF